MRLLESWYLTITVSTARSSGYLCSIGMMLPTLCLCLLPIWSVSSRCSGRAPRDLDLIGLRRSICVT